MPEEAMKQNKTFICIFLLIPLILCFGKIAHSEDTIDPKDLVEGPTTVTLGNNIATLDIPSGYTFGNASAAKKLMELLNNPPSENEVGVILSHDADWFIMLRYIPTGYIKDDDASELVSEKDELLSIIKKKTDESNAYRKKQGIVSTLKIKNWYVEPTYERKTNKLVFAINAIQSDVVDGKKYTGDVINYSFIALGRNGMLSSVMVLGPEERHLMEPMMEKFNRSLSFTQGNRYGEYRAGDKLAEFGLVSLVTGGAAAVALKSGLLQKLGKFIIYIAIAVFAAMAKFFGKIRDYLKETFLNKKNNIPNP